MRKSVASGSFRAIFSGPSQVLRCTLMLEFDSWKSLWWANETLAVGRRINDTSREIISSISEHSSPLIHSNPPKPPGSERFQWPRWALFVHLQLSSIRHPNILAVNSKSRQRMRGSIQRLTVKQRRSVLPSNLLPALMAAS